MQQITKQCDRCKNVYRFDCNMVDYLKWVNGDLIQNAMPYVSLDNRELLISGTCGTCFDKLFGESDVEF